MRQLLESRSGVTLLLLLLLLGVRETTPHPAEDDLGYEGVKARFVRSRDDDDEGGEKVKRSFSENFMELRLPLKDLNWYKSEHEKNRLGLKNPLASHKRITIKNERESLEAALSQIHARERLEDDLQQRNVSLVKGSPAETFQTDFKRSHPVVVEAARQGSLYVEASRELKKRLNLSNEFVAFDLPLQGSLSLSDEFCNKTKIREVPADCEAYRRYRSIDGTCNNFNNPLWGASMTPLLRYLPPFYDDGISEFRRARVENEPLPNPRLLSTKLCLERNVESTSMSLLHMTLGQFLDHDLDFSPVVKGKDGKDLPCCPDVLGDDPSLIHPECAPIAIPEEDPFYAAFNQTCMEFVRSVADWQCELGPRMQVNEKTSYLDGSVVYGTDLAQSNSLRTFVGGLLTHQMTDGEELLPPNPSMAECNKEAMASKGHFCFKSGDKRVNVQPHLTALHIVFSRRHNLIAKDLAGLNPAWDDEKLFQETRRIVVAELQHVVYAEYVASVLGPLYMRRFDLLPLKGEKRTTFYTAEINAAVSASFSGAAFRFGHSQIPGNLQEMDAHGDTSSQSMSSAFMNPFSLYTKGTLANLVRGELAQSATQVDCFFTPQVAGRLFRGELPFGLDLVAVNVQRGRDHGLPPYTAMRAVCNLPLVASFADLQPDIDGQAVKNLESMYSHVDDIDLFIGGLMEQPVPGGLVGPTFACILADQFLRLKVGDRYWYETDDLDTRFEAAQLMEIRNSSLGRILCDVIPELKEVQMNPLRKMSAMNPLVNCSSFRKVRFHPWKEL